MNSVNKICFIKRKHHIKRYYFIMPFVLIFSIILPLFSKATPSFGATTGAYSDAELNRAVALGIGVYQEKNDAITYKQFFAMLDAAVNLAKSSVLQNWKDKFQEARASDNTMRRDEGMLAVFFAAETLGEDYTGYNNQYWGITSEKIGTSAWDQMAWNYPLLPGWNKKITTGTYSWDNYMVAAYFYSMGRFSIYSGVTVFDYDPATNSMRTAEVFTYEEALLAALRLYDSGLTIIERDPVEDASILQKIDERRKAILNSETDIKVTGTSYYVSNSGNDSSDGLSPATAWKTLDRVNSASFNVGDGVFFKRGDVFRGVILCRDNITYSAYGEGTKPKIIGSPENGADPDKWTLLSGTDNIWVYHEDLYDTAAIVFNEGSSWATRKVGYWDGIKYVELLDTTHTIVPKELENLYFLSLPDYSGYTSQTATLSLNKRGKLYLRCDAGNPGVVYQSIEFVNSPNTPGNYSIIQIGSNCMVDNLCTVYGSGGISSVGSHSTIQNCEVAWIGGSVLWFNYDWAGTFNQAAVVRGGGGIGISQGKNNIVSNNYVHHIYDDGISDEFPDSPGNNDVYAENVIIKDNLVEKCSGGIQLCNWKALNTDDESKILFRNILIENNYITYSGYGWSHQTKEYDGTTPSLINNGNSSMWFAAPDNTMENINVKDNLFYISKYALICGRSGGNTRAERYPINFSGNTYVQNLYGLLAVWQPVNDPSIFSQYYFNKNANRNITNVLGDTDATVLKVPSPSFGTETYSTKSFTNQDVTVTIPVDNATVASVSFTFTQNGSHTFTIINTMGDIATKTIEVTNIDKTKPTIKASIGNGKIAKGKVTVTIKEANLLSKTVKLNGKVIPWDNGTFTKKGRYDISAVDKAGNKASYTFSIK